MARKRISAPSPQVISLALQDAHIRQCFPAFSRHISRGHAVWRGALQPRRNSPAYHVRVSYKLKKVPKVQILSPSLVTGTGHLYPDGSLCLYWPKEWQWRADQLIAETIIPWSASWLFFYELWLDTGEWLGPSSHDPPE